MLTRDKIEQMPAGFEITTLVAQQVMGHKWLTYLRYPGERVRFLVPPHLLASLSGEYELWQPGGEVPARIVLAYHLLPQYMVSAAMGYNFSHDIADAWQVVLAMKAEGYSFHLFDEQHDSDQPRWAAKFVKSGSSRFESAVASAPELAICRAALLAKLSSGPATEKGPG